VQQIAERIGQRLQRHGLIERDLATSPAFEKQLDLKSV
jgi:hypothetical protein